MKFKMVFVFLMLFVSVSMAKTIVEVNGQAIKEMELFPIIQKISRGQYAGLPNDKKQMVQKIALEQAIALLLLKEEALKSNIKRSKQYKKAFDKYVKKVVEPTLVYEIWFERELKKIKVSKKEVNKFYKDNKDRFNQPKLFSVYHILLKTENEANDIIATLNKEKDIKTAFLKISSKKMGTSQTGSSYLGTLHAKSNMVAPFKKVYLKMKAHSLSKKAVKTKFGYHVIYVDDVKKEEKKSLSSVRSLVKKTLKGQKLEKILKEKVKVLRDKAKIVFK